MREIYLDNSATTRCCKEAIAAASEAMEFTYGNPSSLHSLGRNAAQLLLNARNTITEAIIGKTVAARLPKRPGFLYPAGAGKLIFTGSGTESNNLAILGVLKASKIKNPRIITTDSEHPSVLSAISEAEYYGAEVYKLSTKNGVIDLEELKNALTQNTVLISVMYVNNETGAIYDLKNIFSVAKANIKGIICHTDCVQAFGKLPVLPREINADMISVSGHKVHAPKGIGALWISDEIKNSKRLSPIIFGGGQEDGYRSGTENLPSIAAFAAAVKLTSPTVFLKKTYDLREIIINNLPSDVIVNTPTGEFLPSILSLTLPVPKSQPMLNFLSAEGIYISSGSACSSHKNTVSHVLSAFGLTNEQADRTVRVSIDKNNTEEEMIAFCEALSRGITKLRGGLN